MIWIEDGAPGWQAVMSRVRRREGGPMQVASFKHCAMVVGLLHKISMSGPRYFGQDMITDLVGTQQSQLLALYQSYIYI